MKIKYIILFVLAFGAGKWMFDFSMSPWKYDIVRFPSVYVKSDILKRDILLYGDSVAYNRLKEKMDSAGRPYEIFYYALIMANKHNYAKANYDVYRSLTDIFAMNPALGDIDRHTDSLRLLYLRRGAERGDRRAVKVLEDLSNVE